MSRNLISNSWCVVAVVVILLGTQLLTSAQQSPQPEPPAASVALLDVSRVFNDSHRFRQLLDEMKGDVEAAEAELRAEGAKLRELAAQFKGVPAGDPLAVRIEAELTERTAKLCQRKETQREEFMAREASIYFKVYGDIERLVTEHARKHDIQVVLRFNDLKMEEGDRQAILQNVNRAVIYHEDGLDITDVILKQLNESAG
jgi:Skp family chaperone for outer membrane proteins